MKRNSIHLVLTKDIHTTQEIQLFGRNPLSYKSRKDLSTYHREDKSKYTEGNHPNATDASLHGRVFRLQTLVQQVSISLIATFVYASN